MYNTTIRSFIFKILFHFYVCWEWVLAGACLMGLQNDKSINLAIGQIQLTRFTSKDQEETVGSCTIDIITFNSAF